ncbi:MtrAB system accessory lipoprotein LpqB [Nocardia sp. XZ_19_369]|uniref:MtrAB system accessory lipoprotein LpqB n=1 Tax=Nocardia sp. XZ_19_369 TaxID=2769487 RepID=UPI00189036A7|nr:MtrAB system accessory lipoprotein LpqB [Nocardia sp. XZ_19_369]
MGMRVGSAKTQRLFACAAAALAALVVLSGCASLPESSAPQALGTIDREPTSEGPPPPVAGRDPDLLLRDFLLATADPTNRHLAARQYMTPSAAAHWDDAAGTTIVEKPDTLRESRTGDKATYRIRARKVAELDTNGAYRASADPPLEHKIEMTKVNDEWRIDELPDGVVMDSIAFGKSYRRYVLYFVDPTSSVVVPDLRWVSVPKVQLTQRLLAMLGEGTQPALAPVLRNELAAPITLRGPITKANGDPDEVGVGIGGVKIDFAGASALNPRDRELLAAQVVLTLAGADILGPYVLLADGKPFDDRFTGSGWSTADVQQYSQPTVGNNQVGLHALRGGALVQVPENNAVITPAPGYFGAVNNLLSASLSPDGQLVAGVADTGRPAPEPPRTLMIGTYGGNAIPVAAGATITRPSWNVDGTAAWAVIDGERVIRAVNDRTTNTVSVQDVDTSALTTSSSGSNFRPPITELRLSRTGVRAALIADGKVYVAVVVPKPGGGYALDSPLPVGVNASANAVSLSWFGNDRLIISREGNVDPVGTVYIDGSQPTPQTSRNLTAPVRQVSASPEHQYAADSRAVLELTSNPDGGEPYWREVPGLGANAVPVLPG